MGLKFSRRNILGVGGLVALGSVAGVATGQATSAKSDKEQKSEQAPGFYRFKLGDMIVTVVSDGSSQTSASSFGTNVPEAQVKAFLKSNLASTEAYTAHANACIIDNGQKRVLIDTGCGGQLNKSQGHLISNIEAAGYSAKNIDIVVLTHLHPDNSWGIVQTKGDKLNFPNARYYVNSVEWDYWMQQAANEKAADPKTSPVQHTMKVLSAIASRTNRIKAGDEIIPGINTLDTAGHTPGHISFQVKSKDKVLIVSGDALYHPYVSFEHPEWHMKTDIDAEKAVKSRQKILEQAVAERALLLGFHLPFPGIGRVASHNKSYRWFPEIWKWEV